MENQTCKPEETETRAKGLRKRRAHRSAPEPLTACQSENAMGFRQNARGSDRSRKVRADKKLARLEPGQKSQLVQLFLGGASYEAAKRWVSEQCKLAVSVTTLAEFWAEYVAPRYTKPADVGGGPGRNLRLKIELALDAGGGVQVLKAETV